MSCSGEKSKYNNSLYETSNTSCTILEQAKTMKSKVLIIIQCKKGNIKLNASSQTGLELLDVTGLDQSLCIFLFINAYPHVLNTH